MNATEFEELAKTGIRNLASSLSGQELLDALSRIEAYLQYYQKQANIFIPPGRGDRDWLRGGKHGN